MTENPDAINQLLKKLDSLVRQQEIFSREINDLRWQINVLKAESQKSADRETEKPKVQPEKLIQDEPIKAAAESSAMHTTYDDRFKKNINVEKFIGENLINKIGIAITVIGVGIGAKYSIDHELISPLVRILLGYLMGLGLLGFGIRLKEKFEGFSAVLVSGAMAILYFITYFAYSYYNLIPQSVAFALMVAFTVFTATAAIKYDRQVIAHIGLVGAYAVPFLLSEKTGNAAVLFSYMAIINLGILIISFVKYWKPLYYSSFLLTWLIYFGWYNKSYQTADNFSLALLFLTVFFLIFYIAFLAYKLREKEKFNIDDVLLLLANSFIFYGIGYSILSDHESGKNLLGLFTLGNAIIHFIVSAIIYRQKLGDRSLFYLITGLVLIFLTIAIPVQLNGNWVTILWAGEAALLFWIGRTKNSPVYEILSYPLMLIAFISLVQDWILKYDHFVRTQTEITPIINIGFLTSLLFIAAFGFIYKLFRDKNYTSPLTLNNAVPDLVSFSIPAILLFTIYYAFRIEIAVFWQQLFFESKIVLNGAEEKALRYANTDLLHFKSIWILNYSLLFLTILSFININKLKNQKLENILLILNTLTVAAFLTRGLYLLSELRENYLEQYLSQYYHRGALNIWTRYISLGFLAVILLANRKIIQQEFIKRKTKNIFDLLFHLCLLWIASSELIHWMDMFKSSQSYKLGLSILWGVYSLILISLGIWKNKTYLRIGAIALFAVILIKLFFYDITHLDTIAKTIVFVSLGVLLLVISFLYNKYKNKIAYEIGK